MGSPQFNGLLFCGLYYLLLLSWLYFIDRDDYLVHEITPTWEEHQTRFMSMGSE